MPEGDNPVGSLGHRKIWALHDLEREALVLEHGARAAEGKMDGSQRLGFLDQQSIEKSLPWAAKRRNSQCLWLDR